MSAYVPFDQMGVFGPALTLLFQTPVTEDGLRHTTKLLKTNYLSLSIDHIKASHRGEFCAFLLQRIKKHKPVTPEKIIKTGFFEKMQCSQISPLHERVKNVLVPAMLIQAKPFVPGAGATYPHQDKINEWLTCFLESYLTPDELNDHCNFQEVLGANPDITSQRNAIGFALYQTFQSGDLTKNDLNAILQGTSSQPGEFLAQADHPDVVADFTNRYVALFSLAGDYSKMLSDAIRSSLDTTFRKKCFP